ncbi:DNA-binding protein [Xenorhabdus stockiae]|uniref:DNA-binding protein n=1 Tax=Xenorhabdus stockiae TaxID=351614 RepID=UPI003CEA2744
MTTSDTNSIQEKVHTICNELYAKGMKPTVRMVLSMLPDVKSTSTVHKYFANWRKEVEANQQSLYDKLGFSSEFTQSFMKEITRFSVEAEQRYKEQALDANEQRDIALEELERNEERLYKQTALIEQRDKEIRELQSELRNVQEQNKSQLVQEQGSHRVIVQELRQQLDTQVEENRSLAASNESLRTEIAKAELRLEGNQEYVGEVKAQNTALLSENKALNSHITDLNKQLARFEATLAGNDKLMAQMEATITAYAAKKG